MNQLFHRSVGSSPGLPAKSSALQSVDLSSAQYRALMQLAHDADAATSLAQKLAVSAPSASTIVDGLVQRGAIERTHSLDDRRRISLRLTEDGQRLCRIANDAVADKLESLAGELETDGVATNAIAALHWWGEALDRARMRRLPQRDQSTVTAR